MLLLENMMSNLAEFKIKEQLLQSQKLETIGSLAGGIAHDFNNMLTSIINNIDMALDDIDDHLEAYECLKDARSVSKHAKNLVGQILAFSKQQPEMAGPIVVYDILLEALEMLKSSVPPGVKVRTKIKNNKATISGISIQIYQVIINICINSFYSMKKKGGVLEIGIEDKYITNQQNLKNEKFVKLTIKDSGEGMSESTLKKIFDPFFTTKSSDNGTGLGLAVVQDIVQGHKGKIYVSSQLGEGTTFQIIIPQIEQPQL